MKFVNKSQHQCSATPKQILDIEAEEDGIYGFICNMCNYVQLTEDALKKHVENEHSMPTMDVDGDEAIPNIFYAKLKLLHIGIEDDVDQCSSRNARVPRDIKNDNKEVHVMNADFGGACVVCDERFKYPVAHYVRNHAEVYTSRITQSVFDAYIAAEPKSKMTENGSIDAMCPICQSNRVFSAKNWLEHITLHSGEYMYRCGRCKHKVPRVNDHISSNCRSKTMEKKMIINAEMDANGIYGYVCRLCNYIQLGRERLVTHVEQQHGIEDDSIVPTHFQKIMLISTKFELPIPPRNDNVDVHCSNPEYSRRCLLCLRKQNNIIGHYVQSHPDSEVYQSRLTPKMAGQCIAGVPESYWVFGEGKIEALCVFCGNDRMFEPNRWIEHMTTHTGEFIYECGHCKHRLSSANGKLNCANCDASKPTINEAERFELEDRALFGYLCRICNYVQLSADRAAQHVTKQHDIEEIEASTHFEKVRLLDLSADGRVKNVLCNDNPDMYASNEKYKKRCVVCGERACNRLNRATTVPHYVRNHAEVYVSRISPQLLIGYEEKAPSTTSTQQGCHRIFCLFCESDYVFNKSRWIRHMTTHTGEYLFKCTECENTYSSDVNHKFSACSKQKTQSLITVNFFQLEENALFAYLCKCCNYMQLSMENIHKHIQLQHQIDETQLNEHCTKYKLLQFLGSARNTSTVRNSSTAHKSIARLSTRIRMPTELSFHDMENFVKLEKNVNKEMYAANEAFQNTCQICNAHLPHKSALVKHCVVEHPTSEVYLSRLSEKIVFDGLKALPMVKGRDTLGIDAFCVFCESYRKIQRSRWIEHLTAHSGEYQYDCSKCNFKVLSKRDHTKPCNPIDIKRTLYLDLEQDNYVFAYVCKQCNFAQLTEERMRAHMRDQHEINDEEMRIQYFRSKILDLTFTAKGRGGNKSTSMSIDDVSHDESSHPRNDNASVYPANPKYTSKCPLCGVKTKKMLKHFNDDHPQAEYYMSRISTTIMECIQGSGLPKGHFNEKEKKSFGFCGFCEKYVVVENKQGWIVHLLRHTNESLYKCNKCKETFNWKHSHLKKSRCPQYHIKGTLSINENENGLSAYACIACNFIQFDAAHIDQHIELHHGIGAADVGQHRLQVKLCNLDEGDQPDPEAERLQALCERRTEMLVATEDEQTLLASSSILTNNVHPSENPPNNLDLTEGSIIESARSSEIARAKNIDRNMYMSHLDCSNKCMLCHESSSKLSSHYARKHPADENYVSRLSTKMMLIAMNHANAAIPGGPEIRATCLFCEKVRSYSKYYWRTHIIQHTGEFTHVCKSCSRLDFQARSNCCHRSQCVQIRTIPVVDNKIIGFACNLCNYVQFSEDNLIKHVQIQHDITERIDEQYCGITFLNLDGKDTIKSGKLETAYRFSEVNVLLEDCGRSPQAAGVDPSNKHGVTEMHVPQEEAEMDESNCVFEDVKSLELTSVNERDEVEVEYEDPSDICVVNLDSFMTECKNENREVVDESMNPAAEPEIIEIMSDDDSDDPNGVLNRPSTSTEQSVKLEKPEEPITIILDDSDDETSSATAPPINEPPPRVVVKTENMGVISYATSFFPTVEQEPSHLTLPVPLKPWTNCVSRKNANVSHQMLHDISLFALFKCMANDCVFTCQLKERMAEHLQYHEQYRNTAMMENEDSKIDWADYLECAYCCEYLTSWGDLIEHIVATHSNNIFQCQYCFYRSIDAYATFIHQQKHHKDKQAVILMCHGFDRTIIQEAMKELLVKQVDSVLPIACPEGKIKIRCVHFFILEY